jgi:ATP-dependent Clp protease ATP-binding subunit ClpX
VKEKKIPPSRSDPELAERREGQFSRMEDLPTPARIYQYLDRYVIGQEKAKRVIAVASYNHLKRLASGQLTGRRMIKKTNILMIGPSGCGKTHIARNLANFLDLPFTVVDATEYTEAGYYGKDVEVMVGELLFQTGMNREDTERGIVFIDEIDKIARREHGARTGAGSRDIGGEGVQQALLKLLEGQKMFIPINVTQHWSKHDFVQIDTTDILFICAGTFSDLQRKKRESRIGFRGKHAPRGSAKKITREDLIQYGMLVEFLGRLPVLVELENLTKSDLEQILKDPPDSVLKEYQALLALDGIALSFSENAVEAIAEKASRMRIGARGLRALLEEIMHDIMFHAPELRGKKIALNKRDIWKKIQDYEPE